MLQHIAMSSKQYSYATLHGIKEFYKFK